MKYQYFIFVFILCLSVSLFETNSQFRFVSSKKISKEILKKEILKRMERVPELRAMKELAEELGIKQVYLFGGSAAAWAHYVYWDLEREAGLGNYHRDRFDYDYTSIFRANQDMDIVVDVDSENRNLVAKFEKEMQKRFPHFQGNKQVWEVRPLRFDFGDKDRILNNKDFINQNSDSHSTGLISVTDNDELGVRDFKDWENSKNHFFADVFNRELHYYRDQKKHFATKRFKDGMNPEIFSAIRYLTKAFQYELEIDSESMKNIRDVLRQFDASKDLLHGYTKTWIEKNAMKLYQNAIDLEFAYKAMLELGLQEKLISIKKNQDKQDSMAWWMNKMPLLTKPLGDKSKGKTARELGIDIIAHETNNFAAYESITKSHSGKANVFISRRGFIGEGALHGDGFYTKIGKKGAKATGLTIRFKLHPDAVEGIDFIKSNEYIIVYNKAVIEVIPESLDISPVEYFRKLAEGGLIFDHSDRGVKEKVKRKIGLRLNNLSEDEKNQIIKIVRNHIEKSDLEEIDNLMKEWFSLEFSKEYPELVERIIKSGKVNENVVKHILVHEHWEKHRRGAEFLDLLISQGTADRGIAISILSKEYWANHERGFELLEKLINNENSDSKIAYNIFTKDYWVSHPKGVELLEKLISREYSRERTLANIANYVLSKEFWVHHDRGLELLELLISKEEVDKPILQRVLSKEYWANHKKAPELLEIILNRGENDIIIAQYILFEKHWANHEKGEEFLDKLILKRNPYVNEAIVQFVVSKKYWVNNPRAFKFLKSLVSQNLSSEKIVRYVLTQEHWIKNAKGIELLEELLSRGKVDQEIISLVLAEKYWANHKKGAEYLKSILLKGKQDWVTIYHLLSNDHWINHQISGELLEGIVLRGENDGQLVISIFSNENWAKHERGPELLEVIIERGTSDSEIQDFVFFHDYWKNHEYFKMKLGDKEVTIDNIREYLKREKIEAKNCSQSLSDMF